MKLSLLILLVTLLSTIFSDKLICSANETAISLEEQRKNNTIPQPPALYGAPRQINRKHYNYKPSSPTIPLSHKSNSEFEDSRYFWYRYRFTIMK